MKKKMLVVGITMASAGSEKAFLGFAGQIDFSKWDVELLLAKKTGAFLPLVPLQIKITEMTDGDIFLIDKSNAKSVINNIYIRKKFSRFAKISGKCVKILFARGKKRVYAKNRLWLDVMESMPEHNGEYDLAVAFWGDRTMFYMIDKVKAKQKITWLHFDYLQPPRENALYGKYFSACDKIVTVSDKINDSLSVELPFIADKIITIENFIDAKAIRELAKEPFEFGDNAKIKLLTVGRICEQKGYDMALSAIAKLISEGYDLIWYILGEKSGEYYSELLKQILALGLSEKVVFLGCDINPYKYMRACDVYFQPSRHEGKPIAVEEAKVLCKPILVTNYSSAGEQLDGGKLGLICEISSDGIYSGLKTIISDVILGDEMTQRLKEMSVRKDVENRIIKLLQEYSW